LLLAATSAQARRSQRHITNWIVPGQDGLARDVGRDQDGYFRISRIVPARLYVVSQDAAVPRNNLVATPKGTLMIPLVDDPYSVCELRRHEGSAFACLTDTDHDGKYDTYFGTQVFNEIFLGSIGDDSRFEQLSQPAELREVDPRKDAPEINLELKYYGMSDGYVKYVTCTHITWKAKYFHERYCNGNTIRSAVDASGNAIVLGQTISFVNAKAEKPHLTIRHSKTDFSFSASFSFP
jgi:hypothetical protein